MGAGRSTIALANSVFIENVKLKNYKSIAHCDINLEPLTFLVGPNGAGKSNFVDALRLVSDSLRTSLDHAIRDRGGIKEVRRRSGGHPTHFEIALRFRLDSGQTGIYSFRIGAESQGVFTVQMEECRLHRDDALRADTHFRVEDGKVVKTSAPLAPAVSNDRLYLVVASGLREFRPVYEALSRMAFYNLNPDRIRRLQPPDAGDLLTRDGSNLASVLGQLAARSSEAKIRIEEYLARIVPGVEGVDVKQIGPTETLEFLQKVRGSRDAWRFLAANMSDGTLRALGILVALFQSTELGEKRAPLVGIEEPEAALHPGAAAILRDILSEGSLRTQVIVTSHSPDLLDDSEIDPSSLISVTAIGGETHIEPINEVAREAIRDSLYTPGELLRLGKLVAERPDEQWEQMPLPVGAMV
jgi:predicted ATPase